MSPRAHKKRRTGSGPEVLPAKQETDGSPDNQIEGVLASTLGGSGAVESRENMNGGHDQGETATDNGAAPAGNPDPAQEMAAVISNIIDHSERVEEQCTMSQQPSQRPAETNGSQASSNSKGITFVKANSHLKVQSLPILDNLVSRKSACSYVCMIED